jgi:hypothetical protein
MRLCRSGPILPQQQPLSVSSLFGGAFTPALGLKSRRWVLQAGLAGLGAGLASTAGVRGDEAVASSVRTGTAKKSVILIWLSGGPSQLDMWDPKPDAPSEIRGPFSSIPTSILGVRLTEHFPLQAKIASKLSFLRAVDCSMSNHTPITMQAGNPLARRTDNGRDGDGYPSMGSVAARFRGANDPDLPAFVGLAPQWTSDIWEAGHMGGKYAPVNGDHLAGRCSLPKGLELSRLADRDALRMQFDQHRRELDQGENLDKLVRAQRRAYEMVSTGKVQKAFDLSQEPDALRDAYGRDSIGTQALLSRRLVEAGVTFITTSARWGYFDNHGDTVPPYLGIEKGLKLLLPGVDRTVHTLVTDLEQRGLLDTTLVLILGEFGRSPVMTKDAGREHWLNVMSMVMAGGGLRHGQAVGSTDPRGGSIQSGAVRPQDIAATVYRHLDIDTSSHWLNSQGRPTLIVTEGGRPIPELV